MIPGHDPGRKKESNVARRKIIYNDFNLFSLVTELA